MIKSILFCALAIAFFSACTNTKIENFFIPPEGKNVSEFYLLHEDGTNSEYNIFISFLRLDEDHFKTSEMNGILESAKKEIGKPELDVKKYSNYIIKNDEIILESFSYYNPMSSEREHYLLDSLQVILKLPKNSEIIEWTTKDRNKIEWNYKAEFTSIEFDGIKKKAIKCTKRIVADKKYDFANTIEYYVEGIGL